MENFGIYVIITKPVLPYTKIAEICAKKEIRYLQLREKDLADRELLKIARSLKDALKGSKTRLVINDRPDIAYLCQADALHLGIDDLPWEEAKKITGKLNFGLSTHSLEQFKAALSFYPDYLGFGPIYPTPTKKKPDAAVGTELLRQVLKITSVPVVAIGGIFPENIRSVLAAGAKNICLVRYLMESTELSERIDSLNNLLSEYEEKQ